VHEPKCVIAKKIDEMKINKRTIDIWNRVCIWN